MIRNKSIIASVFAAAIFAIHYIAYTHCESLKGKKAFDQVLLYLLPFGRAPNGPICLRLSARDGQPDTFQQGGRRPEHAHAGLIGGIFRVL